MKSTLEFSFGAASGCLGRGGAGGNHVEGVLRARVQEPQLLDVEMTRSAAGGQEQGWSQESRPGGTWFLTQMSLRSPPKISQAPLIFQKQTNKQTKAQRANPLLLFLLAFYGDRNKLLFQFRMPSFYWVLVFYHCLKKLDYNEQGISVFYRDGKSSV